MSRERGYDPDAPEDAEHERQQKIILKLIERSNYVEAPETDNFSKWTLGICATLTVSAIVGGIGMYGNQQAMNAKLDAVQQEVLELKKIIEPRYRGETSP
jgi:hypothetical protein